MHVSMFIYVYPEAWVGSVGVFACLASVCDGDCVTCGANRMVE